MAVTLLVRPRSNKSLVRSSGRSTRVRFVKRMSVAGAASALGPAGKTESLIRGSTGYRFRPRRQRPPPRRGTARLTRAGGGSYGPGHVDETKNLNTLMVWARGIGRRAGTPEHQRAAAPFRRLQFRRTCLSISEERTTLLALTGRGRTPGSRPGLRRAAVACGVAALGSSAVVAVAAGGASAASGCQATYSITSQWNTGFGVSVSVTNLGAPISSWTVGWT